MVALQILVLIVVFVLSLLGGLTTTWYLCNRHSVRKGDRDMGNWWWK